MHAYSVAWISTWASALVVSYIGLLKLFDKIVQHIITFHNKENISWALWSSKTRNILLCAIVKRNDALDDETGK